MGSTKLHVLFLPNDDYELGCTDMSGEISAPKYMQVTFDGRTHAISNNNNCCEHGWLNLNFPRPPPLCSPYVDNSSFTLPEVPLYQHFEGIESLDYRGSLVYEESGRGAKIGGIWDPDGATYGPVNFGLPGESYAVLLKYRQLSDSVSVKMHLDDGTVVGTFSLVEDRDGRCSDCGSLEIAIDEEISGIHEVTFTAHRFAGTHKWAVIQSFEILAPPPSASPSMSLAPTMSAEPTITPPLLFELACGASDKACKGTRQSAGIDETHQLRCCADSDLGSDWERKFGNTCPAGVFGASEIGGTCYTAVTYSEGRNICESNGGKQSDILSTLSLANPF